MGRVCLATRILLPDFEEGLLFPPPDRFPLSNLGILLMRSFAFASALLLTRMLRTRILLTPEGTGATDTSGAALVLFSAAFFSGLFFSEEGVALGGWVCAFTLTGFALAEALFSGDFFAESEAGGRALFAIRALFCIRALFPPARTLF